MKAAMDQNTQQEFDSLVELLTSGVAGEEELCVPISLPSTLVERRHLTQTVISAAVFQTHQPTLNDRSQAW